MAERVGHVPGGQGIEVLEIAPAFDALGRVAQQAAAGLAQAVQALVVDLALDLLPQLLLFNGHSRRVDQAVFHHRGEGGAQDYLGILPAQVFAR